MDKQKQWVVLAVAACLGVLAAGWFLLVSPKHAEAADLRQQVLAQQEANAAARTKLAVLKAQAKDLPAEQAKIAAVAAKIPDNPALPALIRGLDAASTESGVELLGIDPQAVAPVGAAAPAGTTAPAGLTRLPVRLRVAGGYFEVQQFVSALEAMPRALRVTSLNVAPGNDPVHPSTESAPEDGRALLAEVSAEVYFSPRPGTAAPTTVVPVTPAAAGAGAPTTTTAAAPAAPAN